jgi:AsmA protein
MLKRRRTEQDELLTRPDAPPVVTPRAPGRSVRPPVAPPPSEFRAEDAAAPDGVEPQRPRRRKRRRGILLVLRPLGIFAALLVLLYLAAPLVLRADRLRARVEDNLGRTLGRTVRIGGLQFTFGLGGLVATDVTVSDDYSFSAMPFAHAQKVALGVERLPLLFGGDIRIRTVDLSGFTLTLIRNSARRWNFTTMLTAGGAAAPMPVQLRGGVVTIRTAPGGEPITLRGVDADFPRFSTSAETMFSLSSAVDGGGTLKLNGKAGPVLWNRGLPALPISVLVNTKKLALNGANITSTLAPALDGLLSFDGTVESDGKQMTVSGNAGIAQLKLARQGDPSPEPLMVVCTAQHDLAEQSGSISRCAVHLGKGSAEITGDYRSGDGPIVLHLKVAAHGVPAPPLASLMAAAGSPLPSGSSLEGGVAFSDLTVDGPLDGPTVAGSVTLNNTKLMNFDLEERLTNVAGFEALHFSRDLPISELTAKISEEKGRVAIESIEVDLPDLGAITGSGTILDDHTLDFQMEAVRNGIAERRPIPFAVRGASLSPIFRMPGKAR